jgi:hypothetical protein
MQNSFVSTTSKGKVTASIDKLSSNIENKANTNSSFVNKLIDGSENSDDNYNRISSLDIEQLQLIFYLDLILIYLILMTVVFLLMKYISTLNFTFDFLKKLPYGEIFQKLMLKLLN